MEYSLCGRKYTAFSRGLESHHPVQWLSRSFAVNNVIFDPNNEEIIILQDDNTIWVINKNKVCALLCLSQVCSVFVNHLSDQAPVKSRIAS